jgi:hypothetical protein
LADDISAVLGYLYGNTLGTQVEGSRPVVKLLVASFGVSRQVAACVYLSLFRGKLDVWIQSVVYRPTEAEPHERRRVLSTMVDGC